VSRAIELYFNLYTTYIAWIALFLAVVVDEVLLW